jgi:nitrite reductase/ring-hydroxylating ferredoxin subunit
LFIFACKKGELLAGQAKQVVVDGRSPMAVFNVNGNYFATDDRCTHGRASLSEGLLDGARIECPFHFGTFDVRTGEALIFPCTVPLRAYRTRIDGEDILVEVESRL